MLKFRVKPITFPKMLKRTFLFGRKVIFRRLPRIRSGWKTLQNKIDSRIRRALADWIAAGKHHEEYPSMDAVAEDLGVSKEQLSYFFTNRLRQRFRSWRKELRIEEAKSLLLSFPHLSASAIGAMVGIPDKSNFRKQFYELTGCTPSEWRAACLGKDG